MHSANTDGPIQFGLPTKKKKQLGMRWANPKLPNTHQRNIFGGAHQDDLFKGYGLKGAAEAKTESLLEKLAIRMSNRTGYAGFTSVWGEGKNNPKIPAGYTYLAQLVAHDLVANVVASTKGSKDGDFTRRDFRNERLVLETLYGGGPNVFPFAYARPDKKADHNVRSRMRLGRPYREERLNSEATFKDFDRGIFWFRQDRHDIPRTSCPYLNENTPERGFSDPLLADMRNDDNLILSQFCTIFMDLHNWMIEETEDTLPKVNGRVSDFLVEENFLQVRKMVALVYRNIVRKDLFSRLLENKTYQRYGLGGKGKPNQGQGIAAMADPESVPVEFSHAVFRAAHGMIRGSYTLNVEDLQKVDPKKGLTEILRRSSSRATRLTPIACDWLVDWEMFFQLNPKTTGPQPNLSIKLRPEFLGGTLTGSTFFKNPMGEKEGGLVYIDLARGAQAGVRNVRSLADKLHKDAQNRSDLLPDAGASSTTPAPWEAPIREWLEQKISIKIDFSQKDLDTLAKDPPLYLYTLFEAAFEQDGECLGVIGSTVVAEVIADALRQNWDFIEGDKEVVSATKTFFGGTIPEDMASLIKAMNDVGRQNQTSCQSLIC